MLLLSTQMSCTFTLLAYFAPSKAIDHLTPSVEFIKRNPHFCPKVTSLPQWIFLKLLKASFTMQIISNPLGDINKDLVSSFYLNVFLLYLIVARIAIWMIFDGQPPKGFFQLVACSFLSHFQQLIQVCFSLAFDKNNQEKQDGKQFGHYKIQIHVINYQQYFYCTQYLRFVKDKYKASARLILLLLDHTINYLCHIFFFKVSKAKYLSIIKMYTLLFFQIVLLTKYSKILLLIQKKFHWALESIFGQPFEGNYFAVNVTIVFKLQWLNLNLIVKSQFFYKILITVIVFFIFGPLLKYRIFALFEI